MLPHLSRYEFIGGKSNHGGRNGPQQFETKPSVQSLKDLPIGLLDEFDACLVNAVSSRGFLSLNASLDDIKRIPNRLSRKEYI